jgi:hypothetical protein
MIRIERFERFVFAPRGAPLVSNQGPLERTQMNVERGLRKLDPIQSSEFAAGDQRHAARADRAVPAEELLRQILALARSSRIADQQRAPCGVVADHGLEMCCGGLLCDDRERDAAIEELDGGIPGHGEFTRDPSVLLCPVAFHVVGGAVVAYGLRHLQVLDWHRPVRPDRREVRGTTRQVVLLHEGNVEQDLATLGRWLRQPCGDSSERMCPRRPREAAPSRGRHDDSQCPTASH